eukprot:506405-Rhodomonas_salina.1
MAPSSILVNGFFLHRSWLMASSSILKATPSAPTFRQVLHTLGRPRCRVAGAGTAVSAMSGTGIAHR